MKALSLTQPMAWAVVLGGKDIENRVWRTPFRGRFYVHASMKFNKEHAEFIKNLGIQLPARYVHGAIIGEADLVSVVDVSSSRWFMGPVGFVLRNAKSYDEPIICKGMLRFFDVENVRKNETTGTMVADSKFSKGTAE